MSKENITSVLIDSCGGDPRAADVLLGAIYTELHGLAEARLARERSGHTLVPTALVHEAYLKLVGQDRVSWQGQTHFRAVAVEAMKRILVDHARKRNREKRGGGWRQVALHDAFSVGAGDRLDVLALHEALETMRELDERQTRVVELRLIGGLSVEETAHVLDVAERTVERDSRMGLAWLRRELERGD